MRTALSYSKFLSHTPENGLSKTLEDHSTEVAKNAMDLCQSSDTATRCAAYCAGLLHDLGKLSPSYQDLFCAKLRRPDISSVDLDAKKSELEHLYGRRQHAIFSCMLAWCLLYGTNPHRDTTVHIVRAILCHHGRLKGGSGALGTLGALDDKFKKSQRKTAQNWEIFQASARKNPEYPQWFGWEKACRSFAERQDIGNYANPAHGIAEYVRGRLVFSALVQGDYLSFSTNKAQAQRCRFGSWLGIDPKKAHGGHLDPSSPINVLREKFQKDAILKYDTNKCMDKHMTIIEAPTGIGKTALLLDIMSMHANKENLSRCYYFSPLIALNNSFVELVKVKHVIPKAAHKFILTYNYASKGTLDHNNKQADRDDDLEENDTGKYNFAHEAFQYPVVITTTQRLMLTLYANHRKSAMKLASLAKSLMIIDEIQTIPRFMLQTTMDLLDRLCEECGSRVVLASATVPAELKKIHTVEMDKEAKTCYLKLTSRIIDLGSVDASKAAAASGLSPLVMFNTRKKAAKFHNELAQTFDDVVYLSTGITRGERLKRINKLVDEKRSMEAGRWPRRIVVSTQVLEAGVDASFGRIWRELAPMDSIVQAMGRLDRSAEMEGNAKLTVFGKYGNENTAPYDKLDVRTTYEMLQDLADKNGGNFTSVKLYNTLEEYYDFTMDKNKEVQEQKEKFENCVKKCQYEKVWDMVAETMAGYNVPIIIPNSDEEWQDVYSDLRSGIASKNSTRDQKMKTARARRNMYKKHSGITAEIPKNKICAIRHMLNEELLEGGILFPKKEHVEELYDRDGTGLDKHLLT